MDILGCSDGDVKLENDGTPMIFWNGVWSPICGHYFWDNSNGARKFCEQLGCYAGGMVVDLDIGTWKHYSVDAFRVGKCQHDDSWGSCTGGCNDNEIGGHCNEHVMNTGMCNAGQPVRIKITCPCSCTKSSSCTGN